MTNCKIHGKTSTYDSFCKEFDSKGFYTNIFTRECRKCRQLRLGEEFKQKEIKEFAKQWKN